MKILLKLDRKLKVSKKAKVYLLSNRDKKFNDINFNALHILNRLS